MHTRIQRGRYYLMFIVSFLLFKIEASSLNPTVRGRAVRILTQSTLLWEWCFQQITKHNALATMVRSTEMRISGCCTCRSMARTPWSQSVSPCLLLHTNPMFSPAHKAYSRHGLHQHLPERSWQSWHRLFHCVYNSCVPPEGEVRRERRRWPFPCFSLPPLPGKLEYPSHAWCDLSLCLHMEKQEIYRTPNPTKTKEVQRQGSGDTFGKTQQGVLPILRGQSSSTWLFLYLPSLISCLIILLFWENSYKWQ